MSNFLRDELVSNLTIHEDSLKHIDTAFLSRGKTDKVNITKTDENNKFFAFLTYIIRFDNKGYRVFQLRNCLIISIKLKI